MTKVEELKRIASQVRRDIIRMVTNAQSGHPGGSLSSTDILTALYFNEMKIDPENWHRDGKDEDVFILSAGHMTPVYYSILSRRGFFPVSELSTFRKYGSRLQGHPSVEKGLPGITQAGVALGKKIDGEDRFVYVLCGDGESEEGQIWEAGMFAAHHKLDNLIAMTDWNGQQIDGTVENVAGVGDLEAKWKAFGWNVIVAEGHDFESILGAFAKAKEKKGCHTMILFKTEMGHGVDFMAGTCKWHGKAPSKEQCDAALAQLEETLGDF